MDDETKVKVVKWTEKKHKVIVRHLPWNLTEDAFIQSIKDNAGADIFSDVSWRHYEKGKLSRTRLVPSFAILVFGKEESIQQLHEQFDGRSFTDSKGYTSKATVEFAPNYQVPRESEPKKSGNIETNEEYLKFCEELDKAKEEQPSKGNEDVINEWLAEHKDEKGRNRLLETPLTELVKDSLWGHGAKLGRGRRKRRRRDRKELSQSQGHRDHPTKNSKGETVTTLKRVVNKNKPEDVSSGADSTLSSERSESRGSVPVGVVKGVKGGAGRGGGGKDREAARERERERDREQREPDGTRGKGKSDHQKDQRSGARGGGGGKGRGGGGGGGGGGGRGTAGRRRESDDDDSQDAGAGVTIKGRGGGPRGGGGGSGGGGGRGEQRSDEPRGGKGGKQGSGRGKRR
ncbi:Regulator of nonsense transcripts UPF3 [Diplonema papillatum]|nr:Regulator of nonsense transcripts UPF3 [Diplonema papillatum]